MPPFLMDATLRALEGYLPPLLVGAGALGRLREVTGMLPAALSESWYLECRLNGEERVDLIVRVGPEGGGMLAGDGRWGALREWCAEWADPESALHRDVRRIWLEFDLEDGVAVPGVFLEWRGEADAGRMAEALAPLGAEPAGLRGALGALPAGARVLYTGLFPSRGGGAFRLCVAGLDRLGLLGYLRAAGWPGPLDELAALTAEMGEAREGAALRDAALVHLDVGAGLHPRVGLEYVSSRREQARGTVAERRFMEHLVERGLCGRERMDALLAWPGCTVERFGHQLWESVVFRRVNHVKLTVAAGTPLQAKAYLTLSQSFRPPPGRASPASEPAPK